jgi:hypothetical protein
VGPVREVECVKHEYEEGLVCNWNIFTRADGMVLGFEESIRIERIE